MKFHFTKRTVTRPNVKSTRRPIFKRTHNSIDSFRAITRNEEIDLFGTFDDKGGQKGSSLFVPIKRVLVKAYTRLKGIFKKRSDRRRKASTRSSLILGAICGVLSVSLVSGVITVFALFGVYEGKYTSITVPDLTSLSLDEATAIQSDSFEYETVYRYNPDKKVGSVIFQSPRAGVSRKLYKNGEKIKITLFINSDTPTVELPELNGMSVRDASLFLKNSGIGVKITEEYSDTVPAGTVILCSHPKGSVLKLGDLVVLRTSKGRQTVYATVPNLCGLSESNASRELEKRGLLTGNITYQPSDAPIGTVISQEYEKGISLPEGTKLSLVISGGQYFEE